MVLGGLTKGWGWLSFLAGFDTLRYSTRKASAGRVGGALPAVPRPILIAGFDTLRYSTRKASAGRVGGALPAVPRPILIAGFESLRYSIRKASAGRVGRQPVPRPIAGRVSTSSTRQGGGFDKLNPLPTCALRIFDAHLHHIKFG